MHAYIERTKQIELKGERREVQRGSKQCSRRNRGMYAGYKANGIEKDRSMGYEPRDKDA